MKNTKTKLQAKSAVIIFIIVFALLYAIIYIVPKVSDIFVSTYTAEYGTLESTQNARCIIIRDETLYKASIGGSVERNAESGDLLRRNSLIATVGGQQHYCDVRGMVSYYYDGYETKINSESMAGIEETFFDEYAENGEIKEAASGTCEPGSVLFKIIDNKQWYLMFWLDESDAESFEEGRTVKAAFGTDTDEPIPMTVYAKTRQGKRYRIILSCNRDYKDFDKYRVRDCRLITSSYSGIILETDSIVEKDGVKGVYVINKLGNEVFVPVSILSSYKGKTVVEKNYFYDSKGQYVETVETYDEILKTGK